MSNTIANNFYIKLLILSLIIKGQNLSTALRSRVVKIESVDEKFIQTGKVDLQCSSYAMREVFNN